MTRRRTAVIAASSASCLIVLSAAVATTVQADEALREPLDFATICDGSYQTHEFLTGPLRSDNTPVEHVGILTNNRVLSVRRGEVRLDEARSSESTQVVKVVDARGEMIAAVVYDRAADGSWIIQNAAGCG